MEILHAVGLTFDDVLLVPKKSRISSRFGDEIDLSTNFLPNLNLTLPIISANMDRVSESAMVNTMFSMGAGGIIHRFMDFSRHASELKKISEGKRIGCIGIGEGGRNRLKFLLDKGLELSGVLIDVAHGHSISVLDQIEYIRNTYDGLFIIAGNVATYEGAKDLIEAGAHSIKVGVGGGSLCESRIRTGNGVPQLTAIMECRRAIQQKATPGVESPTLIADGGIRDSGDCCKALASGADMVMVGNVLAGSFETPGEVLRVGGSLYKNYRGSASREAQEDWKGKATSVEGASTLVPFKGPVEDILNDFLAGVKSGFSYQNARNIKELQTNVVFIRQTSAGHTESTPHGIRK